jgi:hypothetical protein
MGRPRLQLQQIAFVAKLAPIVNGNSQVLFTAFLAGGDRTNYSGAERVAVDPNGNVVVAGLTVFPDFPTQNAYQPALRRGDCNLLDNGVLVAVTVCADAFLTKLSPDGRTLLFSTFFGGQNSEFPNDLAIARSRFYLLASRHSVARSASRRIGGLLRVARGEGRLSCAFRRPGSARTREPSRRLPRMPNPLPKPSPYSCR